MADENPCTVESASGVCTPAMLRNSVRVKWKRKEERCSGALRGRPKTFGVPLGKTTLCRLSSVAESFRVGALPSNRHRTARGDG